MHLPKVLFHKVSWLVPWCAASSMLLSAVDKDREQAYARTMKIENTEKTSFLLSMAL